MARSRVLLRLAVFLVLLAGSLTMGVLHSEAALVDMLDDTIYDTDTQLSWLKDANYTRTSNYDADGRMTWAEADDWARNLNINGLTDWRLPTADPGCGWGVCGSSEMGHLYYTELHNQAWGGLNNTGNFTNLQAFYYWTDSGAPLPNNAWYYDFSTGTQGTGDKSNDLYYAWAVRPGTRTPPTPVGYNPQWLIATLVSLMSAGGYLLRRRRARQ